MNDFEHKPAGYSSTDTAEVEAINLFRVSIDTKLVKIDIKERDKYPNIDGYIELVDDNGCPIGKLEVQIRKILDGRCKYQCPKELFVYAGRTALPVILVCVDTKNKKVFWRHIREEDFPLNTGQASLNISFDLKHSEIISDKKYYARWLTIANDYIQRIKKYNLLRSLASNVTSLPSTRSEEVGKIQEFLDELNGLLDGDYACVKRIKFPGMWKIGFGLSNWTKDSISYSLFAVEKGENKPLICRLGSNFNIFSQSNIGMYGYYGQNKLLNHPRLAAKQYVYNSFKEILKYQLLSIRHPYFCREYLMSYIDTHLYCLGLNSGDSYRIEELEKAFYDYLPRWCNIALKSSTFYPPHLSYIDPGIIRMLLKRGITHDVEASVKDKVPIQPITIGSSRFSFGILFNLLEYCKTDGLLKIERLYKTRTTHSGSQIWDGYKEEDGFYNFNLVYENFERVYSEVLKLNNLNDPSLALFEKQEFMVCQYTHPKPPLKDYPGEKIYRLFPDSENCAMSRVVVLPINDSTFSYGEKADGKWKAKLGNKKFSLKTYSNGTADFLFHSNPMFNLVHETLLNKVESLIKNAENI
ncbi:MAG: DUF4365 domain-containing protein [Elusimicrobia bacterium]|nr:DUF4365 domain-containing protein [Elusimicrobiota bacterium]